MLSRGEENFRIFPAAPPQIEIKTRHVHPPHLSLPACPEAVLAVVPMHGDIHRNHTALDSHVDLGGACSRHMQTLSSLPSDILAAPDVHTALQLTHLLLPPSWRFMRFHEFVRRGQEPKSSHED